MTTRRRGDSPDPTDDDVFATGKLIVELMHLPREGRSPGRVEPGLSTHGIRAAIHLYQHGEMSIGELAEGLGISRGWASRVVEELQAAGHVSRERQSDDRRAVHVRLDPRAVEHVEAAYRWRADVIRAALDPFDADERSAIRRFLRSLVDGLRPAVSQPVADDERPVHHEAQESPRT